MPKEFPKIRPQADPQNRALTSIVLTTLGGVALAGVVYGVSLWSLLLVLRQTNVISEIVSYRWCVAIAYIYVLVRSYDKQLFSNKQGHPPPSKD